MYAIVEELNIDGITITLISSYLTAPKFSKS